MTRRAFLGLVAALPLAGCATSHRAAPRAGATTAPSPALSVAPSVAPSPPSVTAGAAAPVWGGPVPFTAGKALLGSYLALDGMSYPQALALRHKQLGRDARIAHVFYEWADTLPSSIPDAPDHAIPMVSWRGTAYAEITSGRSDKLIAAAARNLRRFGRPVLLRWAWEMNGNWFDWCGARNGDDPAGYVTAWRRIHRIFQEQDATNVAWVWSPNWNSWPRTDWNVYASYYPGDKYVDWVGVSGYNLEGERPGTLYDPIYRAYAKRKPIILSEIGAVDHGGSTKADWIAEFSRYMRTRPKIGAVVWFDTDTHPGYAERWRIDTDSASLAAFKAMGRTPRFSA
ncbi:glycosyl hydrolase [Actinoplanes oblitus]|uniref:Glycosyl hydrolase n=1 Tax=Actinoplanes oblitus TaxID=3040509 RepID=A0ABY8WNX0_9ACTN|nr:glycosyl hydrolase [Actinoplanes oblitus]WIM99172.1 glycosyl hydrolase [Actinoplanes oblitus]